MKFRLLIIIALVVVLVGIAILAIGMSIYFEIHETEQRLLDIAKAGSSVPTISYENLWIYFATSAMFLAMSGVLFVWRKRKCKLNTR